MRKSGNLPGGYKGLTLAPLAGPLNTSGSLISGDDVVLSP